MVHRLQKKSRGTKWLHFGSISHFENVASEEIGRVAITPGRRLPQRRWVETSPLRAQDADEVTTIELDGAGRTRVFEEPAEQIEMLAIRAATLQPTLTHSESCAEVDELTRPLFTVQIAHEMRAKSGRQTCATRPILRMVEVDQRALQTKIDSNRSLEIREW